MPQFIYTMNRVGKIVPPNKTLLKDISLSFFKGAKIGVLGLNGAGKSTLLKIMAGIDTDIEGEIQIQTGIKVGYLAQEPELDNTTDVRTNVELGISESKDLIDKFNKISTEFTNPDADFDALLKEQALLQDKIDSVNAWQLERKLEIAANALHLPPWDAKIQYLSGGERRRVALCRLLLTEPDILLLDEPTNHLDAESIAWLERFLAEFKGTVVAITHDRYFLDNVAGWILELDQGRGIPWEGNYSSWLEQKQKRLATESKQETARQKAMQRELEWIRTNPKGRHNKSKSRIARFEELTNQNIEQRNITQEIYIPVGQRLGNMVIETNHLCKSFDDKLLIDDFSFSLPPGGIVGIIGANGAGKSTLFNILTGIEQPDSGNLKIGDTVQLSFVNQSRDTLDNSKTVWEEISDKQDIIKIDKYEINSRAYISRFNFKGTDQQKYVGDLSGGERNRVHLAKLLQQGGNVLLLDEPTNDLDVETLRALEEALLNFAGCAVVISHDRWFLDRIATHIIAFEGDGKLVSFEGNYDDYEKDKKRRMGNVEPHKIKYKKIK